jgi:hypothetical protein
MKVTGEIDLALGVLDHQLLDCEGRRCGKVDDLELTDVRDEAPEVAAIVVGVSAWRRRGVIARLAAVVARGRVVRVPWSDVDEVRSGVHLKQRASELRLGRGDDRARAIVERVPGSR